MVEWTQRSTAPEYMDRASAAGVDLERALEELRFVNCFLGGRRATLKALEPLAAPALEMLDIGTGAADIPAAVVRWARARGLEVRVVAVDFNPAICAAAAAAAAAARMREIEVCRADVFALPFAPASFDVVHCAMFLHHFGRPEAARIVRLLYDLCRRGLIINDLHRHPLAYYCTKWGSRLFSRSEMVRHDGPVSVLRAFRRAELEEIGRLSGVGRPQIERRWAFRLVATLSKD